MGWFCAKKRQKVFVGLSGGVDSAVSAALLQEQGYDVIGVFIRIALPGYHCSAGDDRIEALRVATYLDVPFIEIDLSAAYQKSVFAPALAEFARGNTPNPDALCNREIKFGLFYNFAREQGASFVATGHYAQTYSVNKEQWLVAGDDDQKDQSYFLWAIPEEYLRHTIFPIGALEKPQVRILAKKFGLPNAARKDSQGLCFLGDVAMEDMLIHELPQHQGAVLNEDGKTIGKHDGAMLYTLGERHGFTLFASGVNTQPHFVVGKNIKNNTITVSTNKIPEGFSKTEVVLVEENWIGNVPDGAYLARFRYRGQLVPASLVHKDTKTTVTLTGAHLVAEGQSLVLYSGSRCLGGGVINTVTLK